MSFLDFFFNDPATTEIYTLSLHDALPIWIFRERCERSSGDRRAKVSAALLVSHHAGPDRKSTRLNSSHSQISYAVFCLKKKKPQSAATTLPPPPACASRPCNSTPSTTHST